MKKDAVTFAQLTARLERAIHADVGLQGLNILLYGWITKYGKVTRIILNLRNIIAKTKCLHFAKPNVSKI